MSGGPSLLTFSARRGLNLAYAAAVEYMSKEDREEFDSSLSMTMLEWDLQTALERKKKEQARMDLAKRYGEVIVND